MKFILPILLLLTIDAHANDTARPNSNNKIGHSKQSIETKQDTFFYKLFNNQIDGDATAASADTDQILSQIEKLADFRKRGILSEEEFQSKKSLLLEKIR
tara:strand:+ start:6915 stop:7214 length:300 start_codon:yes stop_codon:yes gene_type:complete